MSTFQEPSLSIPETTPDDPRIGHLLGRAVSHPETARAVLLGFPSDEGVRINGGRPGAAHAPDRLRQMLARLTPDARGYERFTDLVEHTVDLGNLRLTGTLEENQKRLGRALAPYLARGVVPILLGGGHETSFGHFLGYVQAAKPVAILNWDAHPDVRPLKEGRPHAGSPFRQALMHSSRTCRGYTAAGLQPSGTARAHLDFLREHGAEYVWKDQLTPAAVDALYERVGGPCMVTFDLDAVGQGWAPGVSAPAADGLSVALWLQAAYRAGRSPAVTSVDVVELNPNLDVDDRTARLAALTVWHVLKGLAER